MAADNLNFRNLDEPSTAADEQTLNLIFVSIIKEHPVLIDKSQLPSTKAKKGHGTLKRPKEKYG